MKLHFFEFFFMTLAVLSLAYGVLIKGINSGTGFFMVWILLGIVFFALGMGAHFSLWGKLPLIVKIPILTFTILGFCCFLLVEILILSKFSAHAEDNLDYIIVLGAQVHENGPSYVLARRLDAAKAYLEDNPNTICIVSGGQGYNEPFSEAKGMADYLEKSGIARDRILLEDKSTNTVENIRFSKSFIPDENASVGIVTNSFHVYRGVQIAKKQGLKKVQGIAARSYPLFLPNNMLREFFGVTKDFLAGNL